MNSAVLVAFGEQLIVAVVQLPISDKRSESIRRNMRQTRSLQTSTYRVARSGFFDFSCADVRTCNTDVLSVLTIKILQKPDTYWTVTYTVYFLYSTVMLWSALTIDDFFIPIQKLPRPLESIMTIHPPLVS